MPLAAHGRRESVCVHEPEPLQAFELYYFTYLVSMLVDSSRNQNLINMALCVDGLVHMLVSHGHLSSLRAAAARGPAARAPRHRVGSLAGRATPVVSKHATEKRWCSAVIAWYIRLSRRFHFQIECIHPLAFYCAV